MEKYTSDLIDFGFIDGKIPLIKVVRKYPVEDMLRIVEAFDSINISINTIMAEILMTMWMEKQKIITYLPVMCDTDEIIEVLGQFIITAQAAQNNNEVQETEILPEESYSQVASVDLNSIRKYKEHGLEFVDLHMMRNYLINKNYDMNLSNIISMIERYNDENPGVIEKSIAQYSIRKDTSEKIKYLTILAEEFIKKDYMLLFKYDANGHEYNDTCCHDHDCTCHSSINNATSTAEIEKLYHCNEKESEKCSLKCHD